MHPEIHTNRLFIGHFLTPFGTIALIHDGDALHKVLFPGQKACDGLLADELPSWLAGPLRGYFRGELQALNTIPLHLEGTPFQQRVWQALRQIPAGETRSYAQLAQAVDNPKGYRAAGSANGRNPCGLVVPCHRVIAANGTLGGYSGGLGIKRWLLRHEGAVFRD